MTCPTVFLLSPADCNGRRAATLFRPAAQFELAVRLRGAEGAALGEVFSYVSGLYFRGKLTYARAFERPPQGCPGAFVISPGRGLIEPDTPVSLADLAAFARVPVDLANPEYTEPLREDVARLGTRVGDDARVVLLGSIATDKYLGVLKSLLGNRLCFPEQFIGMGDMSRGAMLLRAAKAGEELRYVAAGGMRRRGSKR